MFSFLVDHLDGASTAGRDAGLALDALVLLGDLELGDAVDHLEEVVGAGGDAGLATDALSSVDFGVGHFWISLLEVLVFFS